MAGGEALYERYKEALKRGHVASLRGRLDEALEAYAEASAIAPERPTPHTSAGTALLRRRLPVDALRYYEAALTIAPRDETALLGRAQALAALERRPEAADAFDALAEHRESGGRLADAVDAARRGLELAEGRQRRRTLERLIERLRESEPGEPGRVALERALRVLEGRAMPAPGARRPRWVAAETHAVATDARGEAPTSRVAEPGPATIVEPEPAPVEPATVVEPEPEPEPQPEPEPEPEPAPIVEPEPEPVEPASEPEPAATAQAPAGGPEPGPRGREADSPPPEAWAEPGEPAVAVRAAFDRDVPPDADLGELTRLADAALDADDGSLAVERLLDLAAISHARGHAWAAMDACYLALARDPDNVGLHLMLAQLYDESGWTGLATEKLNLLERLVGFDDDPTAVARVAAARSDRA
jgi:tetratricopeptide (TPR) repeat protein